MSLHMKMWCEEGQLQDIFKNSEYFEKYNYKYSSIRIIFFSYLGYSTPEPCARLRPCLCGLWILNLLNSLTGE